MTIHKSKGLENKRVWILEVKPSQNPKFPKKHWELVQDANLQYVAITRASEFLGIVKQGASDEQEAW